MKLTRQTMLLRCTKLVTVGVALLTSATTLANDGVFDIKLSVGSSWQSSNTVQIPNDDQGTRFDLDKVAGEGPFAAVRLEAIWNINSKHAMRVMLAPFSVSETGGIDEPVRFAGATFSPEQPVQGEYQFNSWRLGYRYHFTERENWDFWIGGTLKVRDAEIRLSQGSVSSSDDDLGFVPLLYLAGEYRIGNRWTLAADLDGLAGGPGRAIDAGVGLAYNVSRQWQLGAELRTLEGGADTDTVYNFAWFNSALLTTRFKFM